MRAPDLEQLAADNYAAALCVGDEIIEEIDGSVIEPFRHHLPAALARRGLVAVETVPDQRWVIRRAPKPMIPIYCRHCEQRWFLCEHVGTIVVPDSW